MKNIIVFSVLLATLLQSSAVSLTDNKPRSELDSSNKQPASSMTVGIEKIMRLPQPRMVIFGGSNVGEKHMNYYENAYNLAQKLARNNSSIITGGGPGIMEASNCGSMSAKTNTIKSFGVSVTGLSLNACLEDYIIMPDLYSRLALLTYHADGFILFPGGYGSAQELFSILTLMKIKKIDKVPIVLFGKEYWQKLIDWIDLAAHEKFIPDDAINLIHTTDDVDEAFDILTKKY